MIAGDDDGDDDDEDDDDDDGDDDEEEDEDEDDDDDDDDEEDDDGDDDDNDDRGVNSVAFAGLGEAGVGADVNVCSETISALAMMLLPKQLNSEHFLVPRSNQGCVLLTALEESTYFLHATVC